MTLIASIYLIQFDNDHNQQAAIDDDTGRSDDGPETAACAIQVTAAELARRAATRSMTPRSTPTTTTSLRNNSRSRQARRK